MADNKPPKLESNPKPRSILDLAGSLRKYAPNKAVTIAELNAAVFDEAARRHLATMTDRLHPKSRKG